MKRMKKILIFLLFGISWIVLFWLTSSRTPWMIFQKTAEDEGITVSLGDLAGSNYDRMGFPGGVVRYLSYDDSWLVGTERGELFHISKEGRTLWMHSLGTGKIASIALSQDGKIAYLGEKSPDGYLYALDTKTGDILWKYSSEPIIGRNASLRSEPAPVHINVDEAGNIFAAFYRYSVSSDQLRTYISRIIAFDPKVNELWRFPKAENMDAWLTWSSVAAGRMAFGTSNYENADTLKYNGHAYVLDAKTGDELSVIRVPTVDHFDVVIFRNGPNFSPDGKIFVTTSSDGRGFVFDRDSNLLWQRKIAGPLDAGGLWVNASGRDAYVLPDGNILFGTINTFARDNWQIPAPVVHPSSNSIFIFNPEGTFLWKYQADGEIEETVYASNTIALAIGRNVRTHEYSVHGAVSLDMTNGSVKHYYHTKGPVQNIAVSADGKTMAGIEVPAVTPEGTLIGSYQLHIWEI